MPDIYRYKDNELVHNTANRMVLPSGSLFFLHVIHNKRDGDTGIYYCLAKNEVGKTRSRNASLEVARKSSALYSFSYPFPSIIR